MGYTTYETRELAKRLREELSTAELLLWDELRGRRLDGLKFRRKHPTFTFVLDFYCPAARLCVQLGEVDPLLERKLHFIGVHLVPIDPRRMGTHTDQVLDAIRAAARLRNAPVAVDDASVTIDPCASPSSPVRPPRS